MSAAEVVAELRRIRTDLDAARRGIPTRVRCPELAYAMKGLSRAIKLLDSGTT